MNRLIPERTTNFVRISVFAIFVHTVAAVASAEDAIDASRRNAIVKAIERAAPAVVTINVVDIQRERVIDPLFREFRGFFDMPFARPRIRERAVSGIGTGFVFDEEGHILTNHHVLEGADLIASVTLPSGRTLAVDYLGGDERSDIAVLKASEADIPHVPLGSSSDLMIGEWVIAIGNPFGTMMEDPQPSVSVGVVSANRRRISREVARGERLYQDMIQTDAAINPGNSGGPLVNAHGEVVGMNTMIFSKTGGHQGLGFAIPVDRVKRVAEEIIAFGRRRDPWMGFRGEAVGALNDFALRRFNITADRGVLVTEILKSSPALAAGLDLGDVVVEVNGRPVEHPADIDFVNWSLFVGDWVTLTFNRQGERSTIRFQLEELTPPP